MIISVQLSEEDYQLFQKYAEKKNMSLSELLRQTVIERIEDEYDLALYNEVHDEWVRDGKKSISFEEAMKELDLSDCDLKNTVE